jgi:hypothetical protein
MDRRIVPAGAGGYASRLFTCPTGTRSTTAGITTHTGDAANRILAAWWNPELRLRGVNRCGFTFISGTQRNRATLWLTALRCRNLRMHCARLAHSRPTVVASYGNDAVSGREQSKGQPGWAPAGESVAEAHGLDASGFPATTHAALRGGSAAKCRVVDRAARRDDARPLPTVAPARRCGGAGNRLFHQRRGSPPQHFCVPSRNGFAPSSIALRLVWTINFAPISRVNRSRNSIISRNL